jgi:hypothetical protein
VRIWPFGNARSVEIWWKLVASLVNANHVGQLRISWLKKLNPKNRSKCTPAIKEGGIV